MITTPKNILLVEDDPDDIELFRIALEETSSDYQLSTVGNGNALANILSDIQVPDLIVLDVNLPQKSGVECLEHIRSKQQLKEIPVIILTAYNNPAYISDCLAKGATRYFIKPTTYHEIKDVVVEICGLTG